MFHTKIAINIMTAIKYWHISLSRREGVNSVTTMFSDLSVTSLGCNKSDYIVNKFPAKIGMKMAAKHFWRGTKKSKQVC